MNRHAQHSAHRCASTVCSGFATATVLNSCLQPPSPTLGWQHPRKPARPLLACLPTPPTSFSKCRTPSHPLRFFFFFLPHAAHASAPVQDPHLSGLLLFTKAPSVPPSSAPCAALTAVIVGIAVVPNPIRALRLAVACWAERKALALFSSTRPAALAATGRCWPAPSALAAWGKRAFRSWYCSRGDFGVSVCSVTHGYLPPKYVFALGL